MTYPYFKLAAWDARNLCFRDGKPAHTTYDAARAAAKAAGRYRISRVDSDGRTDLEPFDVIARASVAVDRSPRGPMSITRPPVGFQVIRRR